MFARPDHAAARGPALLLLFTLLAGPAPTYLAAQQAQAQREPARPAEAFADALELYNDRLYAQARRAFERFQSVYPDDVHAAEALYYQANAELALGHEDAAVRLFEQLQARYPAHPTAAEAQLSLSQYFLENEDYTRARSVLERVLENDPDGPQAPQALYGLGETALRQEDYDAALGYFQRIADDYREASAADDALYAIASMHVQLDRYEEAARTLELLAARYPDSPYANTLGLALAEVYYELDDYRRAIEEIERRLPQLEGEDRERALFLRAEAYAALGDNENAIAYYQRFIEEYPGSTYYRPALYGLAWNYFSQENYDQAAEHFAEVRQDTSDALARQATYYEAVSHTLEDRPAEALPLYQEVVRRWPESTLADKAQYEIAVMHYRQRDWEQAGEAFEQLVERYPASEVRGEALYMQGNTHVALGNLDEALERFSQAAALDAAPPSLKEEVAFQRAWLLYRDGQYQDAGDAFANFRQAYPESPRAGDALFWAAESRFQSGQLDRAAALFRQYLNDYSGGEYAEAARYALGWTYFKQGAYQDAAHSFEQFLATYRDAGGDIPYQQDARLRLADSYYALKRYGDAVQAYRQIGGDERDYALYQTGQALYLAGRSAEATDALQQLLTDFPESPLREEARYQIGHIYFQNQDYEQAIEAYRTLIEHHPRDPLAAKAQYGIGDALFNDGRLDDAVDAYRTVLERYADSPFAADAASSIHYALIAQGNEAAADAIIESFAEANPESNVVNQLRLRQAEVKYQSGQAEEALQDFQRFVRVSSDANLLPVAYYYIGAIYADRGQHQEAEGYLSQILDEYPQSERRVEAARLLGDLYRQQDRPQDALRVYEEMASMQPDDAETVGQARYGQSMALLALGRRQEARRLLQETAEAPSATPAATRARLGLARIYEDEGRTEDALDLYRRVAVQGEGEVGAEALYRLGSLLLAQDNPRRAIEQLSRMPDLFPGYPDWIARSYLTQARAFRALGETGEAVQLYDQVIDEFRGTAFAETAAQEKAALI